MAQGQAVHQQISKNVCQVRATGEKAEPELRESWRWRLGGMISQIHWSWEDLHEDNA